MKDIGRGHGKTLPVSEKIETVCSLQSSLQCSVGMGELFLGNISCDNCDGIIS